MGWDVYCVSICVLRCCSGDFIRGLWNRKLWFPCKILTLNAASLTIVAIATKLPVDLNNSMPATMDSKELFANIIALAIL
ncbi:hypothetical protein Tco_1382603, partial [Tanacetum coccineum]